MITTHLVKCKYRLNINPWCAKYDTINTIEDFHCDRKYKEGRPCDIPFEVNWTTFIIQREHLIEVATINSEDIYG
jgi:hypothetical protein